MNPLDDSYSQSGEQMVRYYGFYSNKSGGLRKKAGTDGQVPTLIDSDISRKEFRQNWARLIQKIYPVKFPKGNPIEDVDYPMDLSRRSSTCWVVLSRRSSESEVGS